MVLKPISYISINLGPNIGANDAIVGVRVVPEGRIDNVIYGRTLNPGEPDTGQAIIVERGNKLVFKVGRVKISLADVDRYSDPEPDGYLPLANTVWTWLQIPPFPEESFFRFVFAAARRLDVAHSLYRDALRDLVSHPNEPFIKSRTRIFGALGNVALMCIALGRVVRMTLDLNSRFNLNTAVPRELIDIGGKLQAIRNAFEHIDERAIGRAHQESPNDARSIFNQEDLLTSLTVRYAEHSLNLKTQVIPVLTAGRRFIYESISETGSSKTVTTPIEFGPFNGDKSETDSNTAISPFGK